MTPAAESALTRMGHDAGSAIRDERLRRSWSLASLGERAGVARGSVQAVEAGRQATLETYARLATALGLRPELTFVTGRTSSATRRTDAEDFVHAAMGEFFALELRRPARTIAIDEPYQHFQFAGRADVLAWEDRDLLHIENRTRFPNLQEAAGSYNAKRLYLAGGLADRVGIGPAGWRSVTHVIAGLWSSEVLHVVRLRPATFASLCPDPPEAFEAWLRGTRPPAGVTSTFILLDPVTPLGSRRRTTAALTDARRVEPRYRGYADAAERLRQTARRR